MKSSFWKTRRWTLKKESTWWSLQAVCRDFSVGSLRSCTWPAKMGRQHLLCFLAFKRMLHLHWQSFHCFTKFIHIHIPCGLRSYDSTDLPISRNAMSFMKWGRLSSKVLDLCSQGFHHRTSPTWSRRIAGTYWGQGSKEEFPSHFGFHEAWMLSLPWRPFCYQIGVVGTTFVWRGFGTGTQPTKSA